MPGKGMAFFIDALFFLSGAVGLLYQAVWIKALGLQLGHSAWAISTVVGVYMGGLGLGGWLAGRVADRVRRPLWAYGALELGIALFGLVSLPLITHVSGLLRPFYGVPVVFTALRVLSVLVILLIPTILMGASLPVLVVGVSRGADFSRALGRLYGINTLGAAAGVLATGFYLIPRFGLKNSVAIAVAMGALIGAGAMAIVPGANAVSAIIVKKRPKPSFHFGPQLRPLVLAGISGFLGISFEVGWARLLSPILGSSTYTFSILLTVFLLGTAIGSFIATRFSRLRIRAQLIIGSVFVAMGLFCLAGLLGAMALPKIFVFLVTQATSIGTFFVAQFALVALLVFMPTVGLGFLLPALVTSYRQQAESDGVSLGTVYAVNTGGAILGAFLTGFLLLPIVGVTRTLFLLSFLGAAAGLWLCAEEINEQRFSTACLTFLGLGGLIGWIAVNPQTIMQRVHSGYFRAVLKNKNYTPITADLIFAKDGLSSTITVYRTQDQTWLKSNGKTDASTASDLKTQYLLGHLPMFFHGAAKNACVIGFGSGATVNAIAAHTVDTIDVVELEPAVMETAPMFADVNGRVWEDKRVRVHIEDGRSFLQFTPARYDVIVSEPSNPWIVGVGSLFSREYYEQVKSRLTDGGVFCQWIQTYELSAETLHSMVQTLAGAFPYIKIFVYDGDFICVSSAKPFQIQDKNFREALARPGVAETLKKINIRTPYDLVVGYYSSFPEDQDLFASPYRNTDDNLWLEYRAPMEMYGGTSPQLPMPSISLMLDRTQKEFFPNQSRAQVAEGLGDSIVRTRPGAVIRLVEMSKLLGNSPSAARLTAMIGAARARGRALEESYDYLVQAERLIGQNKNDEALDYLSGIEKYEPEKPGLAFLRGRASLQKNDMAQAKHYFEEAVKINSFDYESLLYLGVIEKQAGRNAEAEAYFMRCLEANPVSKKNWALVARFRA